MNPNLILQKNTLTTIQNDLKKNKHLEQNIGLKFKVQKLFVCAFFSWPPKLPQKPVEPSLKSHLIQLPVIAWQQYCTAPEFIVATLVLALVAGYLAVGLAIAATD